MHKNGNNANIGNRGFAMWKQKNPVENVTPRGIEPRPLISSDSKSNIILPGLTWHVLLKGSLNFCSCTTWFLDLEELRGFSYNQ